MGVRKLAQPDDAMFERNFAILSGTGQELEVVTSDDVVHIGFAAGLDDEYLQLCCTVIDGEPLTELQMALINREYIVRLKGTGRAMADLPASTESAVRSKCSHFQSVAAKHSHNQQTRT